MTELIKCKNNSQNEFREWIPGLKPSATYTAPQSIMDPERLNKADGTQYIPEFQEWLAHHRTQGHICSFKGNGYTELTFFYEPSAIEFKLLWSNFVA